MRIHHALFCLLSSPLFAQEVCDNGIDDDGDLLVDLNDTTECFCTNALVDTVLNPIPLPNPSFECYTLLPTAISQLNRTCDWSQASTPTTDYFVDLPSAYFPPGLDLAPLPDGAACIGGFYVNGWQEYFGVCLPTPLAAGTQNDLSLSVCMKYVNGSVTVANAPSGLPATEIVVYGSPTCVSLPLGTTDCPATSPVSPPWVVLGSVVYTPSATWQTVQISLSATASYDMIAIGPPCALDPLNWAWGANGGPYMFYDALSLVTATTVFNATISTAGSLCLNSLVITADPDTSSGEYQWFQNGIALAGASDTVLAVSASGLGPAAYQFMFALDSISCALGDISIPFPQFPDPNPGPGNVIGCPPMFVSFTNNADPALIGTTFWEFGNGISTFLTDPSYTFMDTGTYQVSVTVTSPDGCIGTDTIYVDVDLCTSVGESAANGGTSLIQEDRELMIGTDGWRMNSLVLVNPAGQLVAHRSWSEPVDRARIPLPHAPGIYFLKIGSMDGTERSIRFVVDN